MAVRAVPTCPSCLDRVAMRFRLPKPFPRPTLAALRTFAAELRAWAYLAKMRRLVGEWYAELSPAQRAALLRKMIDLVVIALTRLRWPSAVWIAQLLVEALDGWIRRPSAAKPASREPARGGAAAPPAHREATETLERLRALKAELDAGRIGDRELRARVEALLSGL